VEDANGRDTLLAGSLLPSAGERMAEAGNLRGGRGGLLGGGEVRTEGEDDPGSGSLDEDRAT
jgi:hypothetical protein